MHAPTMGELMSHNAGFTYGLFGNTPVDKMYRPTIRSTLRRCRRSSTRWRSCRCLSAGREWVYSVSVDIQGYLVEKLSGKTFPDFLRERLFEPLGMKDTASSCRRTKLSRVATIYTWNPAQGRAAPRLAIG